MRAGMNMANMSKCLKCASNDDIITLKVGLLRFVHHGVTPSRSCLHGL